MPNYLLVKNRVTNKANLFHEKGSKRCFPEFTYGYSYESPTYFRTSGGIVNDKTYKNPFIQIDDEPAKRKKATGIKSQSQYLVNHPHKATIDAGSFSLRDFQSFSINPQRAIRKLEKRDHVKNEFFKAYDITGNRDVIVPISENNKLNVYDASYHEAFQNATATSSKPFHKKFNLFSDMVQRNHHMSVFGGIMQRDRTKEFQKNKPRETSKSPPQIVPNPTLADSPQVSKVFSPTPSSFSPRFDVTPTQSVTGSMYNPRKSRFVAECSCF